MIAFRTYVHFTFLFITGCLIIFDESEAQCTLQRRCYFVCNGERGSVIVDLSAIDGQGQGRRGPPGDREISRWAPRIYSLVGPICP